MMDTGTAHWSGAAKLGVLYAASGPVIGWLALLAVSVFRSALIGAVPIASVFETSYAVLPFAYLMGVVPAFLTGVVCVPVVRRLSPEWRRVAAPVVSSALGGLFSAIAFAVTHAIAGDEALGAIVSQFFTVGASAGVICGLLFRRRITAVASAA